MRKTIEHRLESFQLRIYRGERVEELEARKKDEWKCYRIAKAEGIDDCYRDLAKKCLRADPRTILSWSRERKYLYG